MDLQWFRKLAKDERGVSMIEYLLGLTVLAGVAYYCRNVLASSLRAAHNAMVNNVTDIAGN